MGKGFPPSHYFVVTDLRFILKYQGYEYYKAQQCSEQDSTANIFFKCSKMTIFSDSHTSI